MVLTLFFLALSTVSQGLGKKADITSSKFDDFPLQEPIEDPSWFKLSLLELKADIYEARTAGKRGILLYFGQRRCPYCKNFLDDNFNKKDVLAYTKKHFDVIGINVRGDRALIDLNGKTTNEREFAFAQNAAFTPTLLFIDLNGDIVLRLVGYQDPYRFRAALEFVADGHSTREKFRAYLQRGAQAKEMERKLGKLNDQAFFSVDRLSPNRPKQSALKPLVVFFEQGDCHACDVLHQGPLANSRTLKNLQGFDVVQLNMWSKLALVTPTGERLTAREWAEKLNIDYAPTLIFFDEQGKEIIRSMAVIHFYRLNSVLQYVLSKGYKSHPSYQAWSTQFHDSKRP